MWTCRRPRGARSSLRKRYARLSDLVCFEARTSCPGAALTLIRPPQQTEALCVRLLVDGFFEMSFAPTTYSVNVYLKPSDTAARFTRFARAEIEQGKGPAFECAFSKKVPKRKAAKKDSQPTKTDATPRTAKAASGSSSNARGKRKREVSESLGEEDEADEDEDDGDINDDPMVKQFIVADSDVEDSDEADMEWSNTLRQGKRAASPARIDSKRPRKSQAKEASSSSRTPPWGDVIELSSD